MFKKRSKSFDEIYWNVPITQKERFRLFREQHPVKNIQVSNVSWEYIACGKGKKCLTLLAGGARFADVWFQLILALENEYLIIAPTIPSLPKMTSLVEGIGT